MPNRPLIMYVHGSTTAGVGAGWEGGDGELAKPLRVVATHDDYVLLEMRAPHNRWHGQDRDSIKFDYLLYEAADNGISAGVPRLLSLSLLPGCYFSMRYERGEGSDGGDGLRPRRRRARKLLRCDAGPPAPWRQQPRGGPPRRVARQAPGNEGALRPPPRPIGHEWELNQAVPIIHGEAMRRWQTDATVPIGDRFLCFVDYLHGFLLCDMAAAGPLELRSGGAHRQSFFDGRPYMSYSWNMGAAGTGAVRFVSVEPQCCRGGHGWTTCARSRFFFTVTTWTMTLSLMDKPMTWVKDGVLHCEELWALPAYEGLPQVTVESPMVTFDDPDVVCFVVCERDYVKFSDRKVWIVEVDTMSKELRSVVPYTTGGQPENLVPVNLL
ncbi:hypothetical protein SETIT_8G053100v2 [Setaria italica]|uniref:DUF1618 domain-containing protein n=1 Tax=Setaria italica TaxID=4555 RepID=K3ZMY5_SETIT|nr:hypothetical protein SETIT_8G053100v2 [Setaria italica]